MAITFNYINLAVLSGYLAVGLLSDPARADQFTYNYVGGATGYAGTLVLDASSSPSGGGSVADIISMSVTTPTYGTVVWDPSDITFVSSGFDWDSSGVTSMTIQWDIPPGFSFSADLGAGARYDSVAISGASGFDSNHSGQWVVASVPVVESLAISLSGTNAVVSWPTNAVGFQLQNSALLGTNADWTSVTNPAAINSTNYSVTLPVFSGIQFFRLQGTN